MVPDGPATIRYSYKWLSHLGQDRTTYVPLDCQGTSLDEFRLLQTAVCVRAQRLDYGGVWVPIQSKCLPKEGVKPGTSKTFALFDGFDYHVKKPAAVGRLFLKIAEAALPPNNRAKSDLAPASAEKSGRAAPRKGIFGANMPSKSSEVSLASAGPASTRSLVETWRDGVKQAQQEEEEIALISFDEPQQVLTRNSDLLAAAQIEMKLGTEPHDQRTGDTCGRLDESEDLISFESASPINAPPRALSPDCAREPDQSLLDLGVPPIECLAVQHDITPGLARTRFTLAEKATGAPTRRQLSKTQPPCKSPALALTEASVKDLARILELAPGYVSIELNFGRFYLKNLSHSQVDVGSGPFWDMDQMLESLNADDVPRSCISFSTALTTCGPDMDELVKMQSCGRVPWEHLDTRVCYEISCSLEGQAPFIELDATTLEASCRGMEEELGACYAHCPCHSWDMRVAIARRSALDKSRLHTAIADALVASMNVS